MTEPCRLLVALSILGYAALIALRVVLAVRGGLFARDRHRQSHLRGLPAAHPPSEPQPSNPPPGTAGVLADHAGAAPISTRKTGVQT